MSLKDEINAVKCSKQDMEAKAAECRIAYDILRKEEMITKLKLQLKADAKKGLAINNTLSGRLEFVAAACDDDSTADGWRWCGVDVRPEWKKEFIRKRKLFSFPGYESSTQLVFSVNNEVIELFKYLKTYADKEGVQLGELYLYNTKTKNTYKNLSPMIQNQEDCLSPSYFVYAVDYKILL